MVIDRHPMIILPCVNVYVHAKYVYKVLKTSDPNSVFFNNKDNVLNGYFSLRECTIRKINNGKGTITPTRWDMFYPQQ